MSLTIRPAEASDASRIWDLNHEAFGSSVEADLVNELRSAGLATVELVAIRGGDLVGHLLFSPVTIQTETNALEAASLAPMAVSPLAQREGIGAELVKAGLQACRERGDRIAVVLGHPTYYPRFGFSPSLAKGLQSPFGAGDEWMAQELVPSALDGITGTVQYPSPFDRFLV